MADEIRIELVADANGVIKAIEKTGPKAEKAGGKVAKNVSKGISKKSKLIAGAVTAGLAIAATAAAAKFKDIIFDGIAAAQKQDEAVQKLNASLRNTGNFSEATSKSLQAFASGLQATTTFGDEVILDQLAFAQAMGASVDQSKHILSAATDMSAALGIDLNSAVRNISKTLGGYAGELGEVIPELKGLTKEQLMNGEGIELLAGKYQGFAGSQAKTFSGALTQLQNVFGDLMEKIGESVVGSDAFVQLINIATDVVGNFIKNADFSFVAKGLMFVADVGLNVVDVLAGVGSMLGFLTNSDTLKNFSFETKKMVSDIQTSMELQRLAAENTALKTTEVVTATTEIQKKSMEDFKKAAITNTDEAQKAVEGFEIGFTKSAVNIGAQIKQTFGRVLSAGIQHLTNGLMKGKLSMGDFAQSMAGMLGDMAIQIGETLMLSGLGINALFGLSGAAAIAAGAGLIALGSVMKSFAGGSSGGGSTSIPSPTSSFDDNTSIAGPLDESLSSDEPGSIEKQQMVSLTIQGDVLDSEETGTRLLEILNEEFDSKGGRIAYA